MPILTAQGIHKSYGPHVVFDGIDVSVHTGERVGLVGANGTGKSTLARILAGIEAPDGGTVARRRGQEIAYLDQDPHFDPALTAREVVLGGLAAWADAKARYEDASEKLGTGEGDIDALLARQEAAASDVERLGGWEQMHQIESMLGHLGVSDPDLLVETLSGGERRRVALARLLVSRPALAILDEPTNHLDVETVDWLEQYLLSEHEGALLLVTHDRYLLDRVCERTLEIDKGKIFSYDGGYDLYLEQKSERLAHDARTESNRQNFLKREIEWLRRQPKARSTKQKARIDRAEAAKAIRAPRAERQATLAIEDVRGGKTILEMKNLGLERGGRRLVDHLDLFLTQGERVGVVGRNGTGKTTLLAAIVGELEPAEGELVIGQNTKIAYFDQARSGLDDSKSIYDNVVGDQPRIEVNGEAIEPRSYLERFLFDPHKQRQQVGSLSGGERARVALARMLRQSANLVLLDEPTNDLDVGTLAALEGMLVDFGGSALVVTHDRYFLDRVATAILAFEGDGKVVRYPGNYDTYRRLKAEEAARQTQNDRAEKAATGSRPPKSTSPRQATTGLTKAERDELAGILDAIERADAEVTRIETALADPELYAERASEAKSLTAELLAAKAEAVRRMKRWEELEEKKGST